MKIGRSTGKPTKAQEARWDAIREKGCIACRTRGWVVTPEIHHLTTGGKHGQKRLGHDYTIGLCAWHHRGVMPAGHTERLMERSYGPSYALSPRAFRETFGNDDALLAFQNALIVMRMSA
ncbi:hypothetical protein MBSD_n2129 [Mizugakiibacter sediminis]|uniref:Recombination enhancement, RecA-dependent nuclease n=1 Tax=Mizugakiibacter sediminis TaxID=1475481 RepID=A0A0K8QPJ5_9GAMM|nr:Ref family recombination enhancement nuclease [Mizugakiibacter sediminis]GAP66814.1 hypothetical protein MBSD_n2129 [Mizugakiibacter sediminis]